MKDNPSFENNNNNRHRIDVRLRPENIGNCDAEHKKVQNNNNKIYGTEKEN